MRLISIPGSIVALLALGICLPATAKDPFVVNLTIQGSGLTGVLGYSNLQDAIGDLDGTGRLQGLAGYDGSQAANIDFDMRGLSVEMSFPTTDGAQLIFRIPGLVINRGGQEPAASDTITFNGVDRADSIRQLKDFLKNNKFALKAILTELARRSPIDPLAGNPLSLMTQKMAGDFRDGFTHKVSQIWGCGTSAFNFGGEAPIMVAALGATSDIFAEAQARAAQMRAGNEFGVGLGYTSAEADGFRSTGITVPLSYVANLDRWPGHKLRFDMPLAYTDTEGAVSYAAGLGLAYTYPVSEVWTVTSGVGVGATGSEDLGAGGGVSSLSAVSAYTWRIGDYALSMGNGIGKYDSLSLKFGDVEAEADISNVAFTNGLLLTGPNSLIAKNLVMEYSIQDTRLTGDEVYSDSYDEFGVALGYMSTEMGIIKRYAKGGLSYLVGANDIRAIKLNLSVRF